MPRVAAGASVHRGAELRAPLVREWNVNCASPFECDHRGSHSNGIDSRNQRSRRIGIGWRPGLAHYISRREDVGFIELLAEDIDPRRPLPEPLVQLRRRGCEIIVHSVSLSLGSAEGADANAVEHLARVAQHVGASMVSEHISFTRASGVESGHLLPLPMNEASIAVLTENIADVRARLPVPLALENIASFVRWPDNAMEEPEFVTRVTEATGCKLLLDVSNLYANAVNFEVEPLALLRRMPLQNIAYVHIAGGIHRSGLYHDTHAHPVREGPLALLSVLPDVRILLERDDHFPKAPELDAELDAIKFARAAMSLRHLELREERP